MQLYKWVETELDQVPERKIVLLLVGAGEYMDVTMAALKYLTAKKKVPGIYITVNKPYDDLIKTLRKNKIPIASVFFIDLITQTVTGGPERKKNCIFLSSPENLTDLGIALSDAFTSIKADKKFLFLDSLSTLLIYNSTGTVARFSHFLTSKMRLLGISGIIIALEKETDEFLLSQLSQFVDKVVSMEG